MKIEANMDARLMNEVQNIRVSYREIEILELVSEGYTVNEIARRLYISSHTVTSHKKNLLEKFEARNSIDLTMKALRQQIISL